MRKSSFAKLHTGAVYLKTNPLLSPLRIYLSLLLFFIPKPNLPNQILMEWQNETTLSKQYKFMSCVALGSTNFLSIACTLK